MQGLRGLLEDAIKTYMLQCSSIPTKDRICRCADQERHHDQHGDGRGWGAGQHILLSDCGEW